MSKAITAKEAIELLSRKPVRTRNSVNLYVAVGNYRYPITGFFLDEASNDGVFRMEPNDIKDIEGDDKPADEPMGLTEMIRG